MIELLTADEVCARLRICPRTLRSLKRAGAFPYVEVTSKRILYRASDIDAYITSKVVTPPSRVGRIRSVAGSPPRQIKPFSKLMVERRKKGR